jgi:hypothetical protein
MPKGLPQANLTDNARQVLMRRYVRRGDDGKPAETVEEMFWRVAYHVAKVEEQWDADVQKRTVEYYHLLSSKVLPFSTLRARWVSWQLVSLEDYRDMGRIAQVFLNVTRCRVD